MAQSAFASIVPVADQSAPLTHQGSVPKQWTQQNGILLRIDCTPFSGLNFPFSDSSMGITLTISFSWDGGTTFPESVTSEINGSANGVWGKNQPTPFFSRGLPFNSALGGLPDHYRAEMDTINGPITYGVSLATF